MGTATQPTRNVAFNVTENGVSFFLDSKPYVINREHPGYSQIIEALKNRDYDQIPKLMDVSGAMGQFISLEDPEFEVKGALVYYQGKPFSEEVSEKVLRMTAAGMPAKPLTNFLKKVRKNISSTAQRELLLFSAANDFLIHEDGDIIAYKAVREDYLDVHSRTVLNKPFTLLTEEEKARLPYTTDRGVTVDIVNGTTVVSMERSDVDDRRDHTCSFGLHFAAHNYARSFTSGPRMLVLKINPADVVAIPEDYGNAKGRCSRYEVIAEIEDEHIKESGLDRREVFSDGDFQSDGIHYGCGGSSDDANDLNSGDLWDSTEDDEDEDDEPEYYNPDNESRAETMQRVAEILGQQSHDLYEGQFLDNPDLAFENAGLATDYQHERVEEDIEEIYGPDSLKDFIVDDETTLNKIVRHLRRELDVTEQAKTLQRKILNRDIYDQFGFRSAVRDTGLDPNDMKVRAALAEAGLAGWL